MIDIATLWAGAATIGCCSLGYLWLNLRIDRDELRTDLTVERNVATALENRVTNLRADNITLEAANKVLGEQTDTLIAERDSAVRELGRFKAEAVAKKPKRDKFGRFIAKPKPTDTASEKVVPISGSKCAPKPKAKA